MRVNEGTLADSERAVVHPSDGPVVDDRILASPARLRAVADVGLLDTGDEDPFDRWALRATELTGADTALVSLVDSARSFFKSFRRRDGSAGEGREVPISMSLCREVVARDEPLIVDDAMHDPRTKDYGAVRAFPVGAYAGMPLRSAEGHVLGSFCVVDPVAREWTEEEIAALADLSAAVQAELRLRAALHEKGRYRALMDVHQRIHALMLDGVPRETVLAELLAGIEQQADGLRGSIVLAEDGPSGAPLRAQRAGALPSWVPTGCLGEGSLFAAISLGSHCLRTLSSSIRGRGWPPSYSRATRPRESSPRPPATSRSRAT